VSTLRERLRALPSFPDDLPVLDTDAAPDDPDELFRAWLDDAIASGARQPQAMSLATIETTASGSDPIVAGGAAAEPTPVARTLILKDIAEHGYLFSTTRGSKKSTEVAEHPRASMLFFWRESGRQVRVTGTVAALSEAVSQADWRERPSYTGQPNPDWQVYALVPDSFEFMQARLDRKHTRLGYRREAGRWTHAVITTPAG